MFNVFSLTEAVNNAANGNISDITPHAYIGTMEEACEDFRYMLMTEAAEQAEFYARSEEIITEAAFSNPDSVGILVENVFSNMGTRIKEFFAKLKKWILGLIDTMKATDGLQGVTGSFTFDDQNNPIKTASILQLQGGQEVFVENF